MKPKLAISACLLGYKVRYDGKDKQQAGLEEKLKADFDIIPVCPETEAGLGIPRTPIELKQQQGKIKAIQTKEPFLDVSACLQRQAKQWLQQHSDIKGLIVKARSPSCAFLSFPVNNEKINGIFTDFIQKNLPDILIIDEEQLHNEESLYLFNVILS